MYVVNKENQALRYAQYKQYQAAKAALLAKATK